MAAPVSARGWPRLLRPFVARPHLLVGAFPAALVYVFGRPWITRDISRALVAWDVGLVVFIALSLASMADVDHERMRRRAMAHDEGRHFILGLALLAAVASVVAILAELGQAKGHGGVPQALRVSLTAGTIALSWFFVHLVFALHYAHVYYTEAGPDDRTDRGGLDFPDDEAPDYWDFLYFSMVMGATAQTADVDIRSKEIRHAATVHCLISFSFNTAILATMINLAAGLF